MMVPSLFHVAWAGNKGNVGIIFALCLIPMIGIVGLGVDISRTLDIKSTLDAAADAAALSAATQAQNALRLGSSNSAAQSAGQTAGTNMFNSNIGRVTSIVGAAPNVVMNVSIQGMQINATASYSNIAVPLAFGRMFGVSSVSSFAVSNTSKAALTVPRYMNISVAIDVSQSMGIGATQNDISNLIAATSHQSSGAQYCAFGCHEPSPGDTLSNEQIAHANNITLRIDVIKSATQNMITTAQSQGSGLISFGLYELQAGSPTPGKLFTTLAAPSSNYSALYTAAGNIDLGKNSGSVGYGDTDLSNSLPSLTTTVGTSGSGASASTPVQYVFLMTDGVVDTYNGSCTWGHCTGPIDPNWCQTMKNNGVTVGVIYTTYIPMNGTNQYDVLVSGFANNIAPSLQACASSGWFYQASDATDIQTAINKLFQQATGIGILTQ